MNYFNNKKNSSLDPRSMLLMIGEGRFQWKHGISKNEIDLYKGREIIRGRRVSLTFRITK